MQHKRFADMPCPIARALDQVGEWWSMLILRDAFAGKTRFDEFQQSLGIAPNMLTRRLASLVEAGMLARRRYSERPPRDEYVLTPRGHDFRSVLIALLAFGHRHFAMEGRGGDTRIVDTRTQATVDPVLVDPGTGEPVVAPHYAIVRGRPRPLGDAATAREGAGLLAASASAAAAHPAAAAANPPPPAAPRAAKGRRP